MGATARSSEGVGRSDECGEPEAAGAVEQPHWVAMTPELVQLLAIPVCFVVSGVVGLRVGTPVSLACALIGVGFAHVTAIGLSSLAAGSVGARHADTSAWLHLTSQASFCLGFGCLLWIAARFPRGGSVGRLGWSIAAVSVLLPLIGGFAGASPSVVGDDGRRLGPVADVLPDMLASLAAVPLVAWPVAAVVVFGTRFWRVDVATRALMQWPVVGICVIGLLAVAGILLGQRFPAAGGVAFLLCAPVLPFSVAFGPVRHRLLTLRHHATRLEDELAARVAELAESRRRLSVAAERERLHLERNLHDGAQQELLALIAHAERARIATDDESREDALASVAQLARGAYDTVRAVAHGLRPASLDDLGIVAATRSVIDHLPLDAQLTVSGDGSRRFPAEVEGAALFFVSEAVANVLRHARATRIGIVLSLEGRLSVQVCDDGVGGVDPMGAGIRGICDRVEAVGGTVLINSRPGRTQLSATFVETPS